MVPIPDLKAVRPPETKHTGLEYNISCQQKRDTGLQDINSPPSRQIFQSNKVSVFSLHSPDLTELIQDCDIFSFIQQLTHSFTH